MTQISDDRLMEIKARGNQFVDKSRGSYGIPAIEMEQIIDELLSARDTIRRLVENSKALAKSLESEYYDCDNEPCALAYHRELLAELEGRGFESAMKRVLEENAGAWKALADGEEGNGSQPTESHGK
jgi:hypothetical protein